ncbi:MAG: DUF3857 domain-containing protein [Bradymonadia bacterium]|jgi:hypothetical protein
MYRKLFLFLILCFILPSFAIAQSVQERERLDSLIDRAIGVPQKLKYDAVEGADAICLRQPQAAALPLLWAATRLRNTVPTRVYADAFTRAANRIKNPAAKRFAQWQVLRSQVALGEDLEKSLAALGLISKWHIAGPFENSAMEGLLRTDEPELGFSIDKPMQGIFSDIHWLSYDTSANAGAIELGQRINPANNAVAFLVSSIHVDAEQTALLQIASATPFKAWLNTELVAEQIGYLAYPHSPEGNGYFVKLKKGENQIVLKLTTEDTVAPTYVSLLQCRADKSGAAPDLGRCAGAAVAFRSLETLSSLTQALAEQGTIKRYPSCSRSLLDAEIPLAHKALLAHYVFSENMQDSSADFARKAISEADALAAQDVPLRVKDPCGEDYMMAADLLGEDWEIMAAYTKYDKQCNTSPWHMSRMIELQLTQNNILSNLDLLLKAKQLQSAFPKAYTPALLSAGALVSLGLEQNAANELLPYIETALESPNFASGYAAVHSENDQEKYRQALEALLRQDIRSSIYRNEWVSSHLLELANMDAAARTESVEKIVAVLKQSIRLSPYELKLHEMLLQILQAYEYPDDEISAQYKEMLAVAPTDPKPLISYADYLQRRGQHNEANLAFNQALALSPHDSSLRQRLQFVSSGDEAFEQAYIIDEIPSNKDETATGYVSLLDQRVSKIYPNGLSSTFYQIAFEIIDEEGIRALRAVPINYSPSDENIEIISVAVTKKDGSVRRTYQTSESNIADESVRMYYDQRQIVIQLNDLSIGDKVEFRYKRSQNKRSSNASLFFSDIFQLQSYFSKHWNRYVVIAPKSMRLHFKKHDPFNLTADTKVERVELDNQTVQYIFDERGFAKLQQEPMHLGPAQISQFLVISSFDTWQAVANWYIALSQEQWQANSEIISTVNDITQNLSDTMDKIKAIHRFVISNTRYVALEFGIHGHKPYPAPLVLKRRFGDCKDKTSLLKAMLSVIGVRADFVLIRTRPNGAINTDIASPYIFDHAIAYLPEYKLYLDATAESSGIHELPYQDQGAVALIVADDASYELVTTPYSSADDNVAKTRASFFIGSETTEFWGSASYKGIMAPSYRERYEQNTQQHQLYQNELVVSYPGATLKSVNFIQIDDVNEPAALEFTATVPTKDLSSGGSKELVIFPLASPSSITTRFAPSASRVYALALASALRFEIESTLLFPANTRVQLPQNQSQKSAFGYYQVEFELQNNAQLTDDPHKGAVVNSLRTNLTFQLDVNVVQPSDYPAFLSFLQSLDRILNQPVVAKY